MQKDACYNRRFLVWKYSVSLHTLLLRSLEPNKKTIDLLFHGVESIELDMDMTINDIVEEKNAKSNTYILCTSSGMKRILARSCKIIESELTHDNLNGYFDNMY